MLTGRHIVALGAVLAGVVVVASGAFSVQLLKLQLPERMLDVFEAGISYYIFHALPLLFFGWAFIQWEKIILKNGLSFCLRNPILFRKSLLVSIA